MNQRRIWITIAVLVLNGILLCGQSELVNEGSRQVHLDFHTTEHLQDIGTNWDKEEWQQRLMEGHVNSINVFAKGHHGWCYYDTEVGTRHPHLDFDLLKA